MKIVVDNGKCKGSCECIKACPLDAIRLVNGKAVIDHERCDLDGICIPACPHAALSYSEED